MHNHFCVYWCRCCLLFFFPFALSKETLDTWAANFEDKEKRKGMNADEASIIELRRTVELQLTSEDFAEFCVANVTNPKLQFLFSQSHPLRSAYTQLLGSKQSCVLMNANDEGNHSIAKSRRAVVERARSFYNSWQAAIRCINADESDPRRGPHSAHNFSSVDDATLFFAQLWSLLHLSDVANNSWKVQLASLTDFLLRRLTKGSTIAAALAWEFDFQKHRLADPCTGTIHQSIHCADAFERTVKTFASALECCLCLISHARVLGNPAIRNLSNVFAFHIDAMVAFLRPHATRNALSRAHFSIHEWLQQLLDSWAAIQSMSE